MDYKYCVVYGLQIIMLLDSLIIFIIIIMPIRAAKQRRNGIAEPRSGRSDGEGERERLRARQRRQAQFNRPQRRNIILDNQRHIIIQIHLNLITQVRTLDEISEVF